jgi:hypothetical protein
MAAQAIANNNLAVNVYPWPALPALAPGVVRTIEHCITTASVIFAAYLYSGLSLSDLGLAIKLRFFGGLEKEFNNINEIWRNLWLNSTENAKKSLNESMALVQFPEQLGLSSRNIPDTGMKVCSIISGYFNCHEEKAVCEVDKVDFNHLFDKEKLLKEKCEDELADANGKIRFLKNELKDEKKQLNDCRQQGFFSRLVNPK